MADTTAGLRGDLTFQANLVQNLNDIFQTNNLGQLWYNKGKHQLLSITAFNLTVFNENRIVNDGFQHLRYTYNPGKGIAPEAFAQVQYNELIKIGFRSLTGAGARFTVIDNDSTKSKLFVGLSYMYEYEEETTGKLVRAHRANLYASIGFPIGKWLSFDAIGYFQPNVAKLHDIRASVEVLLDVSITRRLSLMIVHSLVYDGEPPEGVRNVFYNFRNGLRYRF